MKEISEISFTGPSPGFKPGMDLGPNASDFDWVKQILTPAHIEEFWLKPTNAEGSRLKKIADERYINSLAEALENDLMSFLVMQPEKTASGEGGSQ